MLSFSSLQRSLVSASSVPSLFIKRTGIRLVICCLTISAWPIWADGALMPNLFAEAASFRFFLPHHLRTVFNSMPVFSTVAADVCTLSLLGLIGSTLLLPGLIGSTLAFSGLIDYNFAFGPRRLVDRLVENAPILRTWGRRILAEDGNLDIHDDSGRIHHNRCRWVYPW